MILYAIRSLGEEEKRFTTRLTKTSPRFPYSCEDEIIQTTNTIPYQHNHYYFFTNRLQEQRYQ